jgi:hypothetical protein
MINPDRFCLALLVIFVVTLVAPSALAVDDAKLDPTGRPKEFKAGKKTVCAVWVENGVWYVRATANQDKGKQIIEGTVTVQKGRIVKGELEGTEEAKKPAKYGKNRKRERIARRNEKDDDDITVHKDKAGFDFHFTNRGHSDGVKFTVSDKAESVTFHISIGGDDNPKQVLIGADGTRPDRATFTLPVQAKAKP